MVIIGDNKDKVTMELQQLLLLEQLLLSGIIGADDVILGGSPVFTFATANVGTGITMLQDMPMSGNYRTQPTLSGDIQGRNSPSPESQDDKVSMEPQDCFWNATLSGIIGADDVILGGTDSSGYAISGTVGESIP